MAAVYPFSYLYIPNFNIYHLLLCLSWIICIKERSVFLKKVNNGNKKERMNYADEIERELKWDLVKG